jgi:hypothetical protein
MRSRQVVWRLDLTPAIDPVNQAVTSGSLLTVENSGTAGRGQGSVRRCLQASKAGWGDAQGGLFPCYRRECAITPDRVVMTP